ncbi:YlaN family protein [Sporosarcina sp. G11-34]|uniref:YlaN family protein n=1 Tax=Sporosarcina sp. G11-34 TaxID=2849605 RepID=UPI0022A9EA95|nr:YlaN family protein [Sporosarcina sp. G11-34]MCZ2257150.1 YlaN family protein [Sporosarcina sp. G11-34]
MDINLQETYQEKAIKQLQADANKIAQLIKVQMDHLTMPQCPLYEEVLDTQMFGLAREIDFAVKIGLIERMNGNEILSSLEQEMTVLHDLYTSK